MTDVTPTDVNALFAGDDANKAGTIANNVVNAQGNNPAADAHYQRLAQETGLPIETVRNNPAPVQTQSNLNALNAPGLVQQYPHTANFLADPNNAAIAHDDVANLQATENLTKRGYLADAWQGIVNTALSLGSFWHFAQQRSAEFSAQEQQLPGLMSPQQEADFKAQQTQRAAEEQKGAAGYAAAAAENPTQHWTGTVTGALSYAPFLEAAPFMMTGGAGNQTYQDLLKNNVDDQTAGDVGLVQGLIQGGVGMLPFGKLAFGKGAAQLITSGLKAGAKAGVAGAAQQGVGDLIASQQLSQYPVMADQYAPTADKMLDSAMFMMGFHLASSGIHGGIEQALTKDKGQTTPAPQTPEQLAGAIHDLATANTLNQLNQTAVDSELRTRDPSKYRDLVANMTAGGPLETLYVDGSKLAEALQSTGTTPDQLRPDLANQLFQAVHTQGDVAIPAADFAAHLAGTKLGDALLPHLKADPEAMSGSEAEAFLKNGHEALQQELQQSLSEKESDQAFQDSAERLHQTLADQVKETGRFTDDAARTMTAPTAAFYKMLAARFGVSPEDMANRLGGLDVASHEDDGHAMVLEQSHEVGADEATNPERGSGQDQGASGSAAGDGTDAAGARSGRAFQNPYRVVGGAGAREGWLGATRIRGKNGIATVYRGGRGGELTKEHFDIAAAGKATGNPSSGLGVWFTNKKADAAQYGTVTEHHLDLRNPKVINAEDMPAFESLEHARAFRDALKAEGHDSLIMDARHLGGPLHMVAFDPEQVVKPLLELNQTKGGKRGAIGFGKDITQGALISLLGKADLSTFLHESGHYFLEVYSHLASLESTPEAIKADFQKVMDYFGTTKDKWDQMSLEEKRPLHELFARSFEHYLFEGKAPSVGMRGVFAKVRAWMLQIYKSADALNAPINDDMRGVFDRMLASEDEIRDAQRRDAFEPLLTAKPEGMSEQEYQAYRDAAFQSTAGAVNELEARSLRNIKWLSNTKDKLLRQLQKQAAEQRRDARMQARREVLSTPAQRARAFLLGPTEKVAKPEASSPDTVDPRQDNLLKAIAKLGGLNRDQAEGQFGIDPADFKNQPVFGKPVLRAEGGKSPDAMAEALHELGYMPLRHGGHYDLHDLGELLHDAGLGGEHFSLAADFDLINHDGIQPTPNSEDIDHLGGRLSKPAVAQVMGDSDVPWEDLGSGRHGMMRNEGMHPDDVAERFGYSSGEGMIKDILAAGDPHKAIEARTDQLMLERHGDLNTPKAMQEAVHSALNNELRQKAVATELATFNKLAGRDKVNLDAIKAYAERMISGQKVGELKPRQYQAAQAKAAKLARQALLKQDYPEVARQLQAELVNSYATKAALDAVKETEKARDNAQRYSQKNVRKAIPGPYLERIDDILDKVDLRRRPPNENKPQQRLIDWAQGQRDLGYEPQIAPWLLELEHPQHYQELTVEQIRGLNDTLKSLEHGGKALRQVTIAGDKLDLDEVVNGLSAKMKERWSGEGDQKQPVFSDAQLKEPPLLKTDGPWKYFTYKLGVGLRISDAALLRQDYKANRYDQHELFGPFMQALFRPIIEANYRKVDLTKAVSDRAAALGEQLGKEWQHSLHDLVDNKTLTDPSVTNPKTGKPELMKLTRGRMLGIARHVGNESNFAKLANGYGWSSAAVWDFLQTHMTAKDWQATQAHWDGFEPLWDQVEAMVRRLGGVPPERIAARPFTIQTKDGQAVQLKGGYSPIDYHPIKSKLAANKAEFSLDDASRITEKQVYKATTTSNGSLNARAEGYTDFVNLEPHSADARIRDTIHDLAYREALLDATKIVNHSEFRDVFQHTFGREEYGSLVAWLKNVRDANANDHDLAGFEKALSYARKGIIMTGIAFRMSTVVKHGSAAALKSLGYLGTGAGAKYFGDHVARMATGNRANEIADAKAKFPEIRSRSLQIDRDYSNGTTSMYEPESRMEKMERFGHWMVAQIDLHSAVPTAWAAYDLARNEGVPKSMGGTGEPMSEADAVAYADGIVRQAHGSALEASQSVFMQSRGISGLFGTLYGFMNNSYGQLRDLYDKGFTPGAFKNNPALVARALSAIIMPALMASWVKSGGPDQKKDESGAAWTAKAIAGEVAGTVPFVRDASNYAESGHEPQIAPIQFMLEPVKVWQDAEKEAAGKESRIVADLSNWIGEWAHVAGMGELGQELQYLRDEQNGKPHTWKQYLVGGK